MYNTQIGYLNKVLKLFLPFVALSLCYICTLFDTESARQTQTAENTKWARVKRNTVVPQGLSS